MGTSIIVLSYNNLDYTKQCLESIRNYTTDMDYEIIIIDNNSNEETQNWLKTQTDIKLQLNLTNRGFAGGCNDGIKFSNPNNDILLLNNDVVVTKNWLNNLVTALYSDKSIGAVDPLTNYSGYMQSIPVNYNTISEMQEFASNFNISNSSLWEERAKLIGYCLLIKREALNKVGLLDENFLLGNFEDDDYSMRIILEGYKLLLCKDTFVHHYGSMTLKTLSNSLQTTQENAIKFKNKWGFESSIDMDFNLSYLSIIPDKENLTILDVYCNGGANGLMLKSKRKNLSYYIAESSLPTFRIASKLHKTYILYNAPIKFDYIIINNGENFLNDVNAKNITYTALQTTDNIFIYIFKNLYLDHNNEYYNKLSLFASDLINNFKLNNILQYTYGNQIILQFFKSQ